MYKTEFSGDGCGDAIEVIELRKCNTAKASKDFASTTSGHCSI
jgi:hypothetical protein